MKLYIIIDSRLCWRLAHSIESTSTASVASLTEPVWPSGKALGW